MGYAVCHQDVTGTPRVEDVSSLEAAVELVERLRNEQGPTDVRVFREVPIEVRTYYKVVIADEDGVASSSGTVSAPPATATATSVAPTSTAPEDRVPPGAFPLGGTTGGPTSGPSFEPSDASSLAPSDGHRRANRFGRGG